MKNFKDLIREIKKNEKKDLTTKQKGLSFKLPDRNANKKLLDKKKKINKINEILKFRDPILETMSYENWIKIEQNQMIAELDAEVAKQLFQEDMSRASRVQLSSNSRVSSTAAAGGRTGRMKKRRNGPKSIQAGPPHTGEIITVATTSGSPHLISSAKTISNPSASAAVFFQLPAASSVKPYYDYVVKDGKGDAGSNNITITSAGGTIDGTTNHIISSNYGTVFIFSDGSNWFLY